MEGAKRDGGERDRTKTQGIRARLHIRGIEEHLEQRDTDEETKGETRREKERLWPGCASVLRTPCVCWKRAAVREKISRRPYRLGRVYMGTDAATLEKSPR